MVQINNQTFLVIIGFIVGLIIIKLLGKFVFRLVGVFILAILGLVYTYFYTDYFVKHKDNKIVQAIEEKVSFMSVIQYQKNRCTGFIKERNDSIICECIVEPLVNDLQGRLSAEQIKAIESDKQLYLKELMTSLKTNQKEIQFRLKERNAIHLWNRMVLSLKQGKMIWDE
jgi:uncharacterized membrane protein (Fun14 family)